MTETTSPPTTARHPLDPPGAEEIAANDALLDIVDRRGHGRPTADPLAEYEPLNVTASTSSLDVDSRTRGDGSCC